MVLRGFPVSRGISVGPAYVYQAAEPMVQQATIREDEAERALRRFKQIQAVAQKQLQQLQDDFSATDADQAMIFAAHQDILCDEAVEELIYENIQENLFALDYAIASAFDFYAKLLSKARDERIRERCADVVDVKNRLLRICRGENGEGVSAIDTPCILVVKELLPSDAAQLDKSKILAIVTQEGNATSHAAILANTLAIPAVLGVSELMQTIEPGQMMAVDALTGEIITDPTPEQMEQYNAKRAAFLEQAELDEAYRTRKGTTADGTPIQIGLNIGAPEDIGDTHAYCDFVGLFRSEFLYMGTDHLPSEDEQYQAYRRVLAAISGPVTLRTLDIGGDKALPYLQMEPEQNPFLGLRALRYCFSRPEVFRTQLRAALRASVEGELWIMLPMITGLEDVRKAKAEIQSVRRELAQEKIPCAEDIRIGVMIEVPAAAMIAERIAREVDFASIGTNDLCQYMTAADRGNPAVAPYYQGYHPGFLRMVHHVIQAFTKQDKPISICGEIAGDPMAASLLVGLGARKLSMTAGRMAAVKRRLAMHTVQQMQALADQALELDTNADVQHLVELFMK